MMDMDKRWEQIRRFTQETPYVSGQAPRIVEGGEVCDPTYTEKPSWFPSDAHEPILVWWWRGAKGPTVGDGKTKCVFISEDAALQGVRFLTVTEDAPRSVTLLCALTAAGALYIVDGDLNIIEEYR